MQLINNNNCITTKTCDEIYPVLSFICFDFHSLIKVWYPWKYCFTTIFLPKPGNYGHKLQRRPKQI